MSNRKLIALLSVTLILALAGCIPPATPVPATCIDFEAPLVLGTDYGSAAGQAPGDVAFTAASGIVVTVWDFTWVSGGGTFGTATIEAGPSGFGSGQTIRTNNINLEFDFSGLGFAPSLVTVDYLDMGGNENISIDGIPTPPFAGELTAAPNPLAGVSLTFTSAPVPTPAAGSSGTLELKGNLKYLRMGGQEFWIDNVCVYK